MEEGEEGVGENNPTTEEKAPEVVFAGQPTTIHVNTGPQVAGGGMQVQTNAVAALVLAILGLMTFLGAASGCCFGPSLCFTIPAMVIVSSDKKKIVGNTLHPDNGMINASNVINIVSLVLALIGIAFYVVVIVMLGGISALGA
tara:strand:- start:381 stop:809 length:429 start_codon:yes stop_codon:yes gene_type:complete